MKLLHKTTREYLFASVSILIVTGIALFAILQKAVGDEMNEQLELQADEIFENAKRGDLINAPLIKITKVPASSVTGQIFGDSMLYDRIQHELEEYHFLKEIKKIGPDYYQATVLTSHIGWDKYYLTIFYIFLLMAILLTGSGVMINYFSNRKIWTPFFANLKRVQNFSVSNNQELKLSDSSIAEFKELNLTLIDLTARSRKEYLALREFTENASHEIQTPLSIIQSKLDALSQLDLNKQMADYIVQAKSGVDRLAKMNRSLLLLAKLDNDIFKDKETLSLDQLLTAQIRNMEDLFASKKITIRETIYPIQVISDKYLAETLLYNLLANAWRYTPADGKVHVSLENARLLVENTGPAPDFDTEHIFQRFTKSNKHVQATGLGLAIVKEICQVNQWEVAYHYRQPTHILEVRFHVS